MSATIHSRLPAETVQPGTSAAPSEASLGRPWRRFLGVWLASTLALLLAVAAFNVAVDPFFVFGAPLVAGFNRIKPATQGRETLAKPRLLVRMQPHTILLGTSKVQVGLDPAAPIWSAADRPVFNLGIPGSFSPQLVRQLADAIAVAPIRRALVFVDVVDLLDESHPRATEALVPRGWPALAQAANAALSRDALVASVQTVLAQHGALPSGLRPNGQMYDGIFREPTLGEGPGALFGQKAAGNAARIADIAHALRRDPAAPIGQLDTLRALIALCHAHGIILDLAFAPVHSDLLRQIDLAGLWPRYLAARAAATAIVAEAGGGRVKLWDFVGFSPFTTEPVPPLGRRAPPLRWFWEPNHFRPEYGSLLLGTLYGGQPDADQARLTPQDLTAHNAAQTAARDRDRTAQPGEWARAAASLTGKL